MDLKEKLEDLSVAQSVNIDLLNILDTHFSHRTKENLTLDYHERTYLWDEYTSLLYQITNNSIKIQRKLDNIIHELYEIKTKNEKGCVKND